MRWPRFSIDPGFGRVAFGLGLIFAITGHDPWLRYLGYFLVGVGAATGWHHERIINYNFRAEFPTNIDLPDQTVTASTSRKRK